nr:iron-siderophore ABC transporter substrate-binding protein [Kineosporia babensis]
MPEGKGSTEDDGVFPRTVVHFQGETKLDAEPERVVVISTGQADALLTLGVVPVGSTSGEGAEMIPQYLKDAFPEDAQALDDVTSVGDRFAPDLESVANLDPDLILMNTAGKDAGQMYASLNAIAPTVATQGTGLYWKQDLLLLADSLGQRQSAESWLDEYQTEAATFGESLSEPGNVSFLRLNSDRTRVFGVASFSGSVAEDIGLARPESQTFTDETSLDISSEQLDLADGDHLFYGVQGGDDSQLTGLPLWDSLAAVQADTAVSVDDDTFYLNTGPTAARGILSTLQETLGS